MVHSVKAVIILYLNPESSYPGVPL